MSPEQVKGEVVGPASDIFSTGVLFYELLTGTAPFSSTSATSIMYKIVHEEPRPPHLINPGVPANLEAVITRSTAKNPAARYENAGQMRDDIESGATPEASEVPSSQDGTMLRARPIEQAMPVSAMTPAPAMAVGEKKKRTGLWIGVGAGALVVVAAAVVVILLLINSKVFKIKTPSPNEAVENPMNVSLEVKNLSGIARVSLCVDGAEVKSLDASTYETQVEAGAQGEHTLLASAYSEGGAVLREASVKYTSKGGDNKPPPGGITDAEVRSFIEGWRVAWENMDQSGYFSKYDSSEFSYQNFDPSNPKTIGSYSEWLPYKQGIFSSNSYQRVTIIEPQNIQINGNTVTDSFHQTFASSSFGDNAMKTLMLKKLPDGRLVIYREESRPF
ncbi:MAG TPA: Ig-like domain-containing protein, partial [Thermoleophilia bacterium]